MKSLIRQNAMLVVCIALPLLVVILFAAASILPRMYTDPPEHDLLLVHDARGEAGRDVPFNVQLTIVNELVVARVSKTKKSISGSIPRIYRYDHEGESFSEINLPITEEVYQLSDGAEIPIPELADVRVTSNLRAPDGYEFRGNDDSSGFITGVFGGGRNSNKFTIAKDGAIVRIRLPATDNLYWRFNTRFLGWVVD